MAALDIALLLLRHGSSVVQEHSPPGVRMHDLSKRVGNLRRGISSIRPKGSSSTAASSITAVSSRATASSSTPRSRAAMADPRSREGMAAPRSKGPMALHRSSRAAMVRHPSSKGATAAAAAGAEATHPSRRRLPTSSTPSWRRTGCRCGSNDQRADAACYSTAQVLLHIACRLHSARKLHRTMYRCLHSPVHSAVHCGCRRSTRPTCCRV
jgi:hypothetical protein